jgi:hypothetical protein
MATGQVSFHSDKKVRRGKCPKPKYSGNQADSIVHVATRDNAIVNRLNKTKMEKEVDYEQERQDRLKAEGRKKKVAAEERVRIVH